MHFKFEKLKQLAASRMREAKETLFLLPSRLFFVTHVDYPEDEKLNEKKVEELVRLSLESQSPFDLNDLLWGFLPYASGEGLLVYATSKEVLRRDYPEALLTTYCFPAFIACFLENENITGLCRFRHGEECAVFRCTKDGYWEGFDKIEEDNAVEGSVQEIVLKNATLHHKGCTFECQHEDGNSSEFVLPFNAPAFWSANLHDLDLRQRRRTEKKTETFCYYTTLTASFLLAAVLLAWIGLECMAWNVNRNTRRLATEEPWIARLKQKEDLLHELALFAKQKQVYFRILNRLNDVRPDSILFLVLKADNGREFEIEGSAQRVDDVHRYVADLQADSTFTFVELRRVTSRNDEVKFSLYVEFEERV
ncbi:MAG: PilN domain-containing protein [Puniceicoccales bacterium]|jgi:hypothetical protein|nr:PilN domain-containing protein [Puniceicoccales bacterium]